MVAFRWIVTAGLVSLAATSSGAALVTNGTFETPVASPSGAQTLSHGSTALTGWTVDSTPSNGVEFGASFSNGPSASGSQSVLLGAGTFRNQGGIEQSLTTVSGLVYTVSLDERNYTATTGFSGALNFGTQSLALSASSESWQTVTTTFTATSSSSLLNITGYNTTADQLIIDNVNVSIDQINSNWVGGAAGHTSDWGTAANWNPTSPIPNYAAAEATFGSQSASYGTVDLGASNRTLGVINLTTGTGTTIQSTSGNYLVLDNSGSAAAISGSGQLAINTAVQLNSDVAVNLSGGSVTFGANVANGTASHGILVSGAGMLVLAGANTYSGATTASSGTLNLANNLALQNSALIASGGAVTFSSSVPSHTFTTAGLSGSGNFALADDAGNAVALNVINNSVTTYSGALSGSGSLNVSGNGVLTLGGNNTYTGNTIVGGGGVLLLANNTALQYSAVGVTGSGVVGFASGVTTPTLGGLTGTGNLALPSTVTSLTLSPAAGNSPTFSGMLSSASLTSLNFNGGGSQTIAGNMNLGTASVNVNSGVVTLVGNNNYSGQTNANGGTLNLNGTHSSGNSLNVVPGAVINVYGTETINGNGNSAQLWIDNDRNSVSGTASMNVFGTLNAITASGNSNLIGQEGSATGALNIMPGGVVNVANDDLRMGNTSTQSPTGILTLYPGSLLTLDSNDSSHTGFIFANNGGGGTGSEQGILNLNGGTIMTGRNVNGGGGTATLNFNGGVLMAMVSSTSFVNLGINSASVANVRNGGAIFNTNGQSITIVSPLSHSNIEGDNAIDGGLTLYDTASVPGVLTLAAVNTYTGPTTIMSGTLALGASASIATSPTIALGNGATLDVTAQSGNFHLLSGQTLTGSGNFNVAGAMTADSGSLIQLGGAGAFGTFNVGGLTLSNGSSLSYDFGAGLQDLINVTGNGGLTLNGGGINLYQADGATPFSTPGIYTLMNFSGALGGSIGNLSLLNPVAGQQYALSATGDAVTLTVGTPRVWTGGGSPALNWSNSANWENGVVPANGQPVVFSGQTGLSNSNDLVNLLAGGILFDSTAGAFDLSGNSIQLGGSIINSSYSTQTFEMNIALVNGNQAFSTAAGNIVVNGRISDGDGSRGIAVSGAGTLVLNASNTYSGGTVLYQGILQASNNSALGSGPLTLAGGEFSSSGAGGLTLANPLVLSGSATLGDPINNGPLVFTGSGTIAAANPQITVNSPVTISGAIGGNNGWTMLGPGMLTLTGSNTFTGTTTVAGGTLQLGTAGAPAIGGNLAVAGGTALLLQNNQIAAAASVSVSNGLLNIGGFNNTVAGVQLTGGTIAGTTGTLTSTTAYDLENGVVTASLAGAVGMNVTTNGTVVLAAADAFTGPTSIIGGMLTVANSQALQYSTVNVGPSGILGFAAGTTAAVLGGLTGSSSLGLATAAAEPVALSVGGNNQSTTYDGSLSGGSSLTKAGTGNLTLGAVSSYGGPTLVSGGTLQLTSITGGNLLPVTTALSIAPSSTLDLNGASQQVLSLNGGGLLTNSNSNQSAKFTISGSGASIFSGEISDSGHSGAISLAMTGGGTFVSTGSANISGPTFVPTGTLVIDGAWTTGVINMTLNPNATGQGSGQLAGSGTIDTTTDNVYYNSTASSTFAGSIVGSNGLEVDGGTLDLSGHNDFSAGALVTAGELILSGSNSYRGGTVVLGGTLQLDDSAALADGSSLTVGDAAAFAPLLPASAGSPAIAPVPEPGTIALLLAALASAAIYRNCRRRK